MVPNPVQAINVSPAFLFRKISDSAGPPTILFDEIDTVFGPKARENEETRAIINAGHCRGAVAGRCVMIPGKSPRLEELPAYCAVAVAGLGDLPDTILSRSVIIQMRKRCDMRPFTLASDIDYTPAPEIRSEMRSRYGPAILPWGYPGGPARFNRRP